MSDQSIISVTVNGDSLRLDTGLSVSELLGHLELTSGKVAVERNREIVPRSQHATTLLHDGDAFEIVHFIGGG